MVAGISGIICVVLVSKGKMINYLFGLIFAYSYFYASWKANFLGEMNTVLYVYLPSQFIGYFVWKENLRQEGGGQVVQAKNCRPKAGRCCWFRWPSARFCLPKPCARRAAAPPIWTA